MQAHTHMHLHTHSYILNIYIYIYIHIFASPVKCVFEPSKEWKSKTINARKKDKDSLGICIKFCTKLRIPISDFRLIFSMREDFRIKITITFF